MHRTRSRDAVDPKLIRKVVELTNSQLMGRRTKRIIWDDLNVGGGCGVCVCVYVYMCAVCLCACVCVCACAGVIDCTNGQLSLCVYVRARVHACVCMCVCVCVCVCMSDYVGSGNAYGHCAYPEWELRLAHGGTLCGLMCALVFVCLCSAYVCVCMSVCVGASVCAVRVYAHTCVISMCWLLRNHCRIYAYRTLT